MTRTLRILLLFVFTGLTGSAFAQEISGRVLDEKKEPLVTAVIQVFQGGILKSGGVTDYDGNYTIKPLDPGYYNVLVSYIGYDSIMETGVVVTPGARTTRNYTMAKPVGKALTEVKIIAYKKPLIDQDKPASHILTSEEIRSIPTTQVTDLASLSAGSYQKQRGAALNIGGARSDGTLYIIDGVQVSGGNINMPQGSVDQLEVITSGIPANYGDVSGGVVNITSRGVSQKMTGTVRLQHSIDGYQNNLATFSVAGPIYKKRIKGDSVNKKPVLGFALSGDVYNDKNRYPSYYKQYQAKGDVLDELQKNPLKITTSNTGDKVYNYSSAFITKDQLVEVKRPDHNTIFEARLNGKLNYQVNENMSIVAGTSLSYVKQDLYNRALIMFSPQATPVRNTYTGRGFIRFTQKFGKSNDTASKHSIISNAYYDVQADYQKLSASQEHPDFKKNIFEYGYVGKFTQKKSETYFALSKDSLTQRTGTVLQGTNLFGTDDGVYYERSELNPYLANYTTQYYTSLNGFRPQTITALQSKNALANGDQPALTYGQTYSPGQTISSYSNATNDQYALTVNASFDLLVGKTRHAIEFGLYYQQRVEKNYFATSNYNGIGSNTLWAQMRQLVSSIDNGNLKLDKTQPIFLVNGQRYTLADVNNGKVIPGASDTIIYNYKNVGSTLNDGKGTWFDQQLRKKLGKNATEDINVDALDPNTFSLDMFTADQLLASGRSFVGYQGYTYTGGSQGSVNFNDFWTQKDANGNYTRPIAAFQPNYIAGYIMDKFNYKDLHFNIGVRVDRYSSNTKVLIDPYSLYPEKTVGQVPGTNNVINGGAHPGNIGNDYVVYVDDNSSTNPNVIGYRAGNNWYDAKGQFIEDPSILKNTSGGRNPEPFLVKDKNGKIPSITDTNFNPNASFTDYTPQVTVQPRLQFSFPISDVANFYAHYDIYAQRPTSNSYATPIDYYYLQQNANQIIDNSNLKSQKTFDYEVGFQQKLNDHSSLTMSAFYKERKNMITVVPYLYAWPTTYYTYGNRDFSTTKGTTLTYDMRATNHLRMNIAYTLQFAEGTGSNANSTNGNGQSNGQISFNGLLQSFIQAGLPNLRYIYALDYDSRHTLAANINYSYGPGEGPVVSGKNIFQRSSLSVIPRARSGEPYTRFVDAVGNTVAGGVNGSRLPWHYGVDLRLDKEFALQFGKKDKDAPQGIRPKRPLSLRGILQVNNLLNTREILGVYGYTGKPDDDGYLTSSYGRQFAPQQTNPQSYKDIYSIMHNSPGNYNYARTMSIALEFNF